MAISELPAKPASSEPDRAGLRVDRVFSTAGVHPYDEITWERRDAVIPGESGNVFEQTDVEIPASWSMTATNVVASKYFRGKLGTPARETSVKQMIDRVATHISGWGREGGYFASDADAQAFEAELVWLLANQHMAFNSPVWFNVGASGTRKPQCSACQPYRARVSTPFGQMPIGEIVERGLVGLPVYDGQGITLVQAVKNNGRKRVYRVELSNGQFIEATADHVVSVAAGRHRNEWKRVDELTVGMRLRVVAHRPAILAMEERTSVASTSVVASPALVAVGGSGPAQGIVDNEALAAMSFAEGDVDVSEAALAGWAQGDGFVGQYESGTNRSLTVEFEVANADERAWVLKHLDVAFPGVHRHERPVPEIPGYSKIRLYGEVLRSFVLKYALLSRREAIRVPTPIWNAKPAVVRAYLRSVFQTDGYVSFTDQKRNHISQERTTTSWPRGVVDVATISADWMRDVQLLLASRGIFSTVYRKREKRPDRQDTWVVSIRWKSERQRFADEIGFVSEAKAEKLTRSLDLKGKACSDVRRERILAITDLGEEEVFDIQTASGEYLSNNVVVHNCFILSVDDDMESILDWFKTEGRIFKGGSGSGINVSKIRSSREHLSGGGLASGPVSFMRGADSVAGSIKSGGTTRRAAKMVVLNADHPDVHEFVWCKAKEEQKAWALGEQGYDMGLNGEAWQSIQFQNANNSVRATDAFMRAALADEDWELHAVRDGSAIETVKARALLHDIAEAAWGCGDPGMQFDTTINDWHTCPASGRINGSNPCAEYMHVDDSACNLASLNLLKFVDEQGELDAARFARAVDVTITAQEILVGNASYPTEKIERNAHAMRQLGLGYANLGALLMSRGLAYDSDEGRAYAAAITALMTGEAYAQSARIAAVVGRYDEYPKNNSAHDNVMQMHRLHAYRIGEKDVPRPLLNAARAAWDDAVRLGEANGYRNAQATVLAPTGTISFMMDCDTTGIEPDIALVKYKKLVGGGTLKLVNGTVPAALRRLGYTQTDVDAITAFIDEKGTIEGAPQLKPAHLVVFDCAFQAPSGTRSIAPMGHIKMMGAVQPFISGAISKTVNLPETATVDDVMNAYVEAWKHGVKAIAIYRDGSKKTQPLSTSRDSTNGQKAQTVMVERPRRRLPTTRDSVTHKFGIEGHEGYITVGLFEDGTPGELFVTMAKQGSTLAGMMDAFATSISLLLQYHVPLRHLVEKFAHTRFEPAGWTGNPDIGFAKSIVDYVFRWLGARFLSEADKVALGLVRTTEIVDAAPQAELFASEVAPANEAAPSRRRLNSTPDAPPCPRCGWLTVRNGTCHKCENCGETTGCS